MSALAGVLILFAVLIVTIGAFSPGTTGIAQIAIGCFLAILARIVQAAEQHHEMLALLGRRPTKSGVLQAPQPAPRDQRSGEPSLPGY